MRTTIEITDEQRAALLALAARRGLRGYSAIIQEAIDFYLKAVEKGRARTKASLKLQGVLTDEQAKKMRQEIQTLWTRWRTG
ncbi:MAG: ribbon-helix-helix protein, CopG family [candidate division NC10 bacterium]|nr:ribbon-helix-helix protein, CopG family [candidate division NC10 bacterium]